MGTLQDSCRDIQELALKVSLQRSALQDQLAACETQKSEAEKQLDILGKVSTVLASLSSVLTQKTMGKIDALVSTALREVFPDLDLQFRSEARILRGSPHVDHYFVDRGKLRSLDAIGGGPIDVASLVLRAISQKLFKLSPVLVLDEALVHVSSCYRERAGLFVKNLARQLGLDIVMVSHQTGVIQNADTQLNATSDNGVLQLTVGVEG